MQIFLDDIRTPTVNSWEIVRTYTDFKKLIDSLESLIPVKCISLDHDLGDDEDGTGMSAVRYLINRILDRREIPPTILIHSANPVGVENMISIIRTYTKVTGRKIDFRTRQFNEGYSDYPYHNNSITSPI